MSLILSILTKIVLAILVGLSIFSVKIIFEIKDRLKNLEQESGWKGMTSLFELKSLKSAEGLSSIARGLPDHSHRKKLIQAAEAGISLTGREAIILAERTSWEKNLHHLATIGSNAPFIGLFGTVLGIIQAFSALSLSTGGASGGSNPVMAAIAEALLATAVGLAVAIPAVVAFNTFNKRIRVLTEEAQGLSSWVDQSHGI